jgi:hypothetical protein
MPPTTPTQSASAPMNARPQLSPGTGITETSALSVEDAMQDVQVSAVHGEAEEVEEEDVAGEC